MLIGKRIVFLLRSWQHKGQPINQYLAEMHGSKKGTPTMGGILILIATFCSILFCIDLRNEYLVIVAMTLILFAILGFIDDYLKIKRQHNAGMIAKLKLIGQFIFSSVIVAAMHLYLPQYTTTLYIPYYGCYIELSWLYAMFAVLVIVGTSNAVNITDGLDGLAAICLLPSICCLMVISYTLSTGVPQAKELVVICAALCGSISGFLWFNAKPAQLFMGDTGSLPLGAALGVIGLLTKHELALLIISGVFVAETVSVILQVAYFKYTKGKRILLMAPLHHHFEKLGWSEEKIVARFGLSALICAVTAIMLI